MVVRCLSKGQTGGRGQAVAPTVLFQMKSPQKNLFRVLSRLFAGYFLLAFSVFAQETLIFESGKDENAAYRIPAIIKLKSGKLLAFAEGRRKGAGDFGDVNIVLKTSVDGGKTWLAMKDVAENDDLQAGNPAPVVDYFDKKFPRGRIFLFYNTGNNTEAQVRKGNGRREVWFKTSVDEGKTWSDAVNISAQVKMSDWRAFANTPGHALQITKGKFKGRILVPFNYSKGEPNRDFSDYMAAAFYSDDHGKTFKISNDVGIKGSNESTAAELPEGGILLNSRNQKGDEKYRIFARSQNGGESWNEVGFDKNLPDPVCQGSILAIKGSTIAFSNNADQNRRNNLTLRISFDAGKTWAKSLLVDDTENVGKEDFTAYSDIVLLDKNRLGILYEKENYRKIVFKIIKWK